MRSRRELMKLLGLAPIVATSATAELTSLMASPAVAAATALSSVGQGPIQFPVSAGESTFGKILGRKIEDLRCLAETEDVTRRELRVDGLDHDIGCLKATSRSYKARKQIERDIEDGSFLRAVDRKIWG